MKKFKEYICSNFNEWLENGKCSQAIELNKNIGGEYFCESNPHFFTGNLYSEIVLVHLNPKRNKNKISNSYDIEKPKFNSFEEYYDYFRYFGRYNYGESSKRDHKSPFDKKQIRFLKPLNILPFTENDIFKNLEIVIDHKLQIELIPFGSDNFNYNKVGIKNIKPFIDNILSLIASKERKYVIFCGRVFDNILNEYVSKKKVHEFKLQKTNGTLTKVYYHFIEVEIKYNDKIINAVIAPQYAMQGMPIEKYGIKLKQLLTPKVFF
jgi:hypothetical protein